VTELLTAAQMRAVEQAAIASGEVTGLELMERAGAGVVAAIFEQWPELAASPGALPRTPGYLGQSEGAVRRAVVVCGPGNNGGDGFVVARLLKERGWAVEVFLYGSAEKLPPDAKANHALWAKLGDTQPLDDPKGGVYGGFGANPPDLVVDAVFGTGLVRPLPGNVDQALTDILYWKHRHRVQVPCVAVDMPSGINSDSGRAMGGVLPADLTVTFHTAKPGHFLADGPEHSGKIVVVDIGLPVRARFEAAPNDVVRLAAPGPGLGRLQGHKYSHGHALILSGGPGRTGAARLAARGALRVGAGLVTLGVPPAAQSESAAQVTAVMLARVEGEDDLAALLRDARISALCLGPGLGVDRRGLVAAALDARVGETPRPTVLDADALTILAGEPELFARLHARCVLTPHAGEFARLFPDITGSRTGEGRDVPVLSKVDATREAARRAGCVVVFKGADTVIAGPDGRCVIHAAHYERAAPWLATAGSGDVLAGFITGLLARGFQSLRAAEAATWLHVECARSFGPGLIAEDLPEELPKVFRALGL
jgi:hydroxyethylthiazole kinase-like uncharacterized protein yjeF